MTLLIDFQKDWTDFLKDGLKNLGYCVDALSDPREISLAYFNAIKRRIPQRARAVRKSREFACPEKLSEGLKAFEDKVARGLDLNRHLSRELKKVNYGDYILNDWRIYHFHLGQNLENDGFVERTGPVLFAMVTPYTLYEINIYEHRNWSNIEVIDIVHKNWPDLIASFRLDDIIQLRYTADSSTIKKFRVKQLNAFIQMSDGTVYSQPGLGYATDGTGVEVAVTTSRYYAFFRHLEESVKDNIDVIVAELESLGYSRDQDLELRLLISDGYAYMVCEKYKAKFKLHSINIG